MFVISKHEVLKWHRFGHIVSRVVTHLWCNVKVKCYRIDNCVLLAMVLKRCGLLRMFILSLLNWVSTLCNRSTNVLETFCANSLVSAELFVDAGDGELDFRRERSDRVEVVELGTLLVLVLCTSSV